MGSCPICNAPGVIKCAVCGVVSYCRPSHQKKHLKLHKSGCASFSIEDDPQGFGKCFVATKDIKAGTIILEEDPVLLAPTSEQEDFLPMVSCITCGIFTTTDANKGYLKCSKCKWPVCRVECEKRAIHAQNECKIFASKCLPFPPPLPPAFEFWKVIMAIRALLLKQKDPSLFDQIWQLQSNTPQMSDIGLERKISLIKSLLNMQEFGMDDAKLVKLIWIFAINSFCYGADLRGSGASVYRASHLYIKASRINHSCAPNCRWKINTRPDFEMRIITTVDVKKGEPLTVEYFRGIALKGTKQRQEKIWAAGFLCNCARCLDPTELGTFASAVVCSACRKDRPRGYFLPEDPLNQSRPWKCNHCGAKKLPLEILPPIEKIGRMIAQKEMKFGGDPTDDTLINFCKAVVEKYDGKYLHPNHWVLQNAKRAIFDYLSQHRIEDVLNLWDDHPVEKVSLDLDMREYHIQCGLYLLGILDVLAPGISNYRASIQEKLADALNDLQWEKVDKGTESGLELTRNNLKRMDLLDEVTKFERNEFSEGEMPGWLQRFSKAVRKQTRNIELQLAGEAGEY